MMTEDAEHSAFVAILVALARELLLCGHYDKSVSYEGDTQDAGLFYHLH